MSRDLTLRPASAADCARTFAWADDPATRAASFQVARFSYPEHERWFAASLAGDARVLRIAQAGDEPVGIVRFDRAGAGTAEYGITLAPEHRGLGLAVPVTVAACREARALGFCDLVARVRTDNERTHRMLLGAGFKECGREVVHGVPAIRFRVELGEMR